MDLRRCDENPSSHIASSLFFAGTHPQQKESGTVRRDVTCDVTSAKGGREGLSGVILSCFGPSNARLQDHCARQRRQMLRKGCCYRRALLFSDLSRDEGLLVYLYKRKARLSLALMKLDRLRIEAALAIN